MTTYPVCRWWPTACNTGCQPSGQIIQRVPLPSNVRTLFFEQKVPSTLQGNCKVAALGKWQQGVGCALSSHLVQSAVLQLR